MTLDDYRRDFELSSNRSLSMPIAGAIVWASVAILSTQFAETISIYIMLFGTGAIFPIALLIAKLRKENLLSSSNPFSKLMGLCILMVNLLWAVHIPLLLEEPKLVPLSLGIALGLHWIVYSWIIQHSVGIVHSVVRSILILLVWYLFPDKTVFAVSSVIVFVYVISISQMLKREVAFGQ